MFDWNDEEITNIIWGEAGENDDHIVPYPGGSEEKPSGLYQDQTRKEWNERAVDVNSNEPKNPVARTDLHGSKLEKSPQYDRNEKHSEPWPDSNVAKTDQDSVGTEAPKNLSEISKHGETSQDSKCSAILENQQDKEQGDIVDYDWANIGSFDDLDRIFSNNDPIFGHTSLGNSDELWPSSKDVTGSPEKSIPMSFDSPSMEMGALKSTSDPFEMKSENILHQNHRSEFGHGNMNNVGSNTPQDLQARVDTMGYTGGKMRTLPKEKRALEVVGTIPVFNSQLSAATLATPDDITDKRNRPKKFLKTRVKSEEKSEVRELQEICSTWSTPGHQFQQFDTPYAPTIGQPCSPLLMSQQRQFFPGPFLASSMYATIANQYPPMAVPSQFSNHPKVNPGYEVSPSNSDHAPQTMSPREKIEKLRRRQQMRAMLAIQKQQQQFSNQVSSTAHPIMEGANTEVEENLNIVPTLEPNPPVDHDDLSMEDSVLYQLQHIIGKLDNRIRLCIRDSLFRLAQSTTQRKYANDLSRINSGSRDEMFNIEESNSHNRFGKMPDVETQTNPIDRTVAHLLFHRPLVSSGKHAERPESPSSAKLHCERKEAGSMSLAMTYLPQSSDNNQILSQDESKSSFCVDTSENASKKEAADGAALRF